MISGSKKGFFGTDSLFRRTKIVCTIGPASSTDSVIESMILAGMDVARLNLSHGKHAEHAERTEIVKKTGEKCGRFAAVMMDLPGPKLRLGNLQTSDGCTKLKCGDTVRLCNKKKISDPFDLPLSSWKLVPNLKPGDTALLSDGAVQLEVTGFNGNEITASVRSVGLIRDGAGVVFPGKRPDVPFLTPELNSHVFFAATALPDFISLSFVSCAADVLSVKELLNKKGADIPIIAKIEQIDGVNNFEEILEVSDGIMVARGDLGVELPIQKVPIVQKEIIKLCNRNRKPVITATEMLESMISHARPTRAEVTDVANAIYDGTDATMLSAETSIGMFPVQSVHMMSQIATETELNLPYRQILEERSKWHDKTPEGVISFGACYVAEKLSAKAVVAFTNSGKTAERASACRPEQPIFAITPNKNVYKRLLLSWGVMPYIHEQIELGDEIYRTGADVMHKLGVCKSGDNVVILAGIPPGNKGITNMIKVEQIP